jgi:hypothetical protein
MNATGFDEWIGQRLDLFQGTTGIKNVSDRNSKTGLIDCYPNPAVNETVVSYFVQRPTEITLKIFDLNGRELRKLNEYAGNYGRHEVPLKIGDLKPGEYIIEMRTGNYRGSLKLLKR